MTEKKSMDHCYSKVKTPTGVFTFHDESVLRCKAKQICAAKGEVLAPLTKQEDRVKLRKGLKLDDEECYKYLDLESFHDGTEIEVCDGKPVGYTPTGEKVDNLDDYIDMWFTTEDTFKFVDTIFIPVESKGLIDDSGIAMLANGRDEKAEYESKFICMKPAAPKSSSEALASEFVYPFSFYVACCLAISTIGLAIAFFREKRRKSIVQLNMADIIKSGQC